MGMLRQALLVLHVSAVMSQVKIITQLPADQIYTRHYSIDGSAQALRDFEDNNFSPQDGDGQFERHGSCLAYLQLRANDLLDTYGKTTQAYQVFPSTNFLKDVKTDIKWGLDLDIGNQGSGFVECSSRATRKIDTVHATCPNCMAPSQQVVIFVDRFAGFDEVRRHQTQTNKARCMLSQVIDCIPQKTCRNGEYVNIPITTNKGAVTNAPTCIPCAPGTWLTCKDTDTCEWPIPESREGPYAWGSNIVTTQFTLVGSCFPCNIAHNYAHYSYSGSPNQVIIQGTGGYVCKGGADPPRVCPVNTSPNKYLTACECVDGYYSPAGESGCTKCEPGYMCKGGLRSQCPMHKYQPEAGKAVCIPCSSTGDQYGQGNAPCNPGELQQWCDTSNINTQNVYLGFLCVVCTQCRRPYLGNLTNAQGTVNCYRG